MIILTTSTSAQTLKVIPRQYDDSDFTMSIRDDSTNVTKLYQNLSGTTTGNYLTFTNVFTESPSPAVFWVGWYGPDASPQ